MKIEKYREAKDKVDRIDELERNIRGANARLKVFRKADEDRQFSVGIAPIGENVYSTHVDKETACDIWEAMICLKKTEQELLMKEVEEL